MKHPISKRRKPAYRQKYERRNRKLAAKRGKSCRQQDRTEQTDADQKIHRQQHDAERFGEKEKQREISFGCERLRKDDRRRKSWTRRLGGAALIAAIEALDSPCRLACLLRAS